MLSNERTLQQWLTFSGWFNILAAFPLMMPGLADLYLTQLSRLNTALGWGGAIYEVPNLPVHALLINTAGADLVLVGLVVLYAARQPLARKGIIVLNAIFRSLFIVVVLYYVFSFDLMRLFVLFALADVIIVAGFAYGLYQLSANAPPKLNQL
ncbi:MAG: hypothetical protein WBA23_19835 [Tunicatimonas sp.]|uniref:hypothetical protein n=1 Tax=Tunicatimonas sp. TaxID=1940096 RepID=UPI003C733F3A